MVGQFIFRVNPAVEGFFKIYRLPIPLPTMNWQVHPLHQDPLGQGRNPGSRAGPSRNSGHESVTETNELLAFCKELPHGEILTSQLVQHLGVGKKRITLSAQPVSQNSSGSNEHASVISVENSPLTSE
ncbi:unnamed protein product [Allacma fusca]|uniref:Uncharacterized protein n=1 Tax=Allacma fusca TaxID=39272 RepID=A0A8J2NK56_9HEXA|nr:unnamed protein product [Allacma fusca]